MPRRRWFARVMLLPMLAGCAATPVLPVAQIPESLRVPAMQVLTHIVEATGVQIYECRPGKEAGSGYAWIFVAPEAELRDARGKLFGRHYAGPTWEARDGSKVLGEVRARDNGPDPAAIPWLLLAATSASDHGVLAHTSSIQRLRTVGGRISSADCHAAEAGQRLRVPYQAEYRFYVAAP